MYLAAWQVLDPLEPGQWGLAPMLPLLVERPICRRTPSVAASILRLAGTLGFAHLKGPHPYCSSEEGACRWRVRPGSLPLLH